MPTWIIFPISLAAFFFLDRMKDRKGGWWAEAHYLIHTLAVVYLAVALPIALWTDQLTTLRTVLIIIVFLVGAYTLWHAEHMEREARHANEQMRLAFERERQRNPDFMKGFEITEGGLIYRERIKDGPDNA